VTRVLKDVSLRLQVEHCRVGARKRLRIVDSDFIAYLVLSGPGVSLAQVQHRTVTAEARGRMVRRMAGLKLVTSMTSVLPSQRPLESPMYWRMAGDTCGRAS
jgi:hypothetical protein